MVAIMSNVTGRRWGAKEDVCTSTDDSRAAGGHEGLVPRLRVARSSMKAPSAKSASPGHRYVSVAPSSMLVEPISMLNTSLLLSDMVIVVAETYEFSLVH